MQLTHIELSDEAGKVVVLEVAGQELHREGSLISYNETETVLRGKLSKFSVNLRTELL